MASEQRFCVRLLSGTIVYEGLRPQYLRELQDKVAAASAELQADRDFAMKAVACNSQALLYLSEKLRGDLGVKMASS